MKFENSRKNLKLVYHENGIEQEMDNSIIFREFAGLSVYGNYLIKNGRFFYFRYKTFFIEPYSYKTLLKLEFKSLILTLIKNTQITNTLEYLSLEGNKITVVKYDKENYKNQDTSFQNLKYTTE